MKLCGQQTVRQHLDILSVFLVKVSSQQYSEDLTVDLFDSAQECCDDSIGFVYMCALLRVQVWMHKALTITMLIGLRGDALKTVMAQPLVEVSQRGGIRCTHHQPSVARIYGRTQQIVL